MLSSPITRSSFVYKLAGSPWTPGISRPRLRRQENRDHTGLTAIDDEAVVAEAALGRRHGVAQHRATAAGSAGSGGFFEQFDVCRSKTQRKNTSLTRHLTLHRHRRHHRDRQHVLKPCHFVTHPEPKISRPLNLKMGQEVPKTLVLSPLAHFFFDDRAADGRKHSANMRWLEISKKYAFLQCALFPTPKKEGSNQGRGSKSGSRIEISILPASQRGHPDEKGGQKGSHSEF